MKYRWRSTIFSAVVISWCCSLPTKPLGPASIGVVLGQNPPEIAYWERGRMVAVRRLGQPEAMTVVSHRLVFSPSLKPA
jgi:hypothetical protein